jgi:hypothetical protein
VGLLVLLVKERKEMTKNERDLFQRHIMVAIRHLTRAYELDEPVKSLGMARELLREAQDMIRLDNEEEE